MKKPTPRVRVLDSTRTTASGAQAMIGSEYEVHSTYHYDGRRMVWNKDKSGSYLFNESDLQLLTPLTHNGVAVGIGDTVERNVYWHEVYDFVSYDGKWLLLAAKDGNYKGGCYFFPQEYIRNYRPLQAQNKMTDDQLLQEVKRRGLIESKDVIK